MGPMRPGSAEASIPPDRDWPDCANYLMPVMNWSMGIAAIVRTRILPREASSAEIFAIVVLSGASTTFTKS